MNAPAQADSLMQRRKSVRLRLRADLIFSAAGEGQHVVKDPLSLRYFRFDDYDRFLLVHFDGEHTLEQIREGFETQFAPRRLSLEDLEGFAQTLLKAGLITHEAPHAGQVLYEARRKRQRLEWTQRLTNILYVEIPLFDPDRLLVRLASRLGWLFHPRCYVAALVLFLATLIFLLRHLGEFRAQLPSFEEFFGFKNLLTLWLTIGLIKTVHELGHGICCKNHGGEVHDMGVLFMCLTPCFYLNVSDAWTFPEKSKRMAVGVAGIYIELLIASLATYVWWHTPGEPWLRQLSLCAMVVCGVNTLLYNGNPLLRFDGYYVLADWLDIPNLRERANQEFRQTFASLCLGTEEPRDRPLTPGRRTFLLAYAFSSYLYGWLIAFGVLWMLTHFLKPHRLETLGYALALLSLGSMFGWPVFSFLKGLKQRGGVRGMKVARAAGTATCLTILLLAFVFLPLPVSRIRQTGLVQIRADARDMVFPQVPGTLQALFVQEGEWVEQGTVLAELRNRDLEERLEKARSQGAIRVVQVRALRQHSADTVDPGERGRIEKILTQTEGERAFFERMIESLEKTQAELVLKAPRDGHVLGLPRREEIGVYWDRGQNTPLCTVGDVTRLRLLVPVSPADYQLLLEELAVGSELPATVRIQGWDRRTWAGRVAMLPESEARQVPMGLTFRAGGPVAMQPASKSEHAVPQSQQYLVGVDLVGAEADRICPGSLGQVKIHCRPRSAGWWTWRAVCSAFNLRLAG